MFVFSREYLRPALLMALLSVWVLVGVCFYLNAYTRRRYFTVWSAGWLFYALWLTVSLTLPNPGTGPWRLMFEQTCVGLAATFMLWGASIFLNQKTSDRVFGLFLAFLAAWSYVSANSVVEVRWVQLPVYSLMGLGSGLSAYGFYAYRHRARSMGANLLSVGFLLWGAYLASYPLWESSEKMISSGFFISAALQLFIAVSMIVLVLEEARAENVQALRQIAQQRSESEDLRTRIHFTEERYRSLFSQASEAIVIAAADNLRILELNQAARLLLGITGPDHGPHLLNNFLSLGQPDDPLPATGPEWFSAICGHGHVQVIRPDGRSVPAEVSGAPVEFSGATTYQLFFRELTERARLEQQLRQAEKLSALGQMISGVAHELNNPLAVIKGYLDLMLSRPDLGKQTRADLQKVVHESNRAVKLVGNFLSFARERAPQRQAVQINELIQRVIELREMDLRLAGIQWSLDLEAGLPQTLADPEQLEQVLINLITNSLHALSEAPGPRRLAVQTQTKGQAIHIRVEDSGPGIPSEVLPHIYEPFFTTKEVGTGTGLGLSIAHSIVAEHKGRISYDPPAEGGAGFLIEIPIVEVGPPEPSPEPAEELEQESAAGSFGGARILVVDDEEVLAGLLAEILSALGHYPQPCSSGAQALQLLEQQPFDIVLSDFRMPLMNGRELYERIQQRYPELARRMIFLTGDVVTPETRTFLENTGNPHLPKPFRLEAVAQAIAQVQHKQAISA